MSDQFKPHEYAESIRNSGEYAHEDGVLYRWTGTHWGPLKDDAAEAEAYRWIVQTQRSHASRENARRAIGAALLWTPELPALTREVVIPCSNGYVHLKDGEVSVLPPDAQLGIRHVLKCEFEGAVKLPERFLDFIESVLPDEAVRSRVQEYIGYTLTSDARYQRAQLWLGSGANGKGVLANIVQELHGRPESVQLDALDGFGLSALIGASLIYSDEAPRGRVNESLLKTLIAGEKVKVDRKYRDPISVNVRGKWLILGNHLPTISDHSAGFWRRWDVVPFGVTIQERDRDPLLADHIILHELSGVLMWALEGLIRLQKRGAFDVVLPQAMSQMLRKAKHETNSVQAWCDDCDVTVSPTVKLSKAVVYTHYKHWCESNGMSAVASPRFWLMLKEILPVEGSRRREGSVQVRECNVNI